jgi:hypothetical protein
MGASRIMADKNGPVTNFETLDLFAMSVVGSLKAFCTAKGEPFESAVLALVYALADMTKLANLQPEDVVPHFETRFGELYGDVEANPDARSIVDSVIKANEEVTMKKKAAMN